LSIHDEVAFEHNQGEGVDLPEVLLELLDVLVVHHLLDPSR
jgi:hypothetical protein